MRGIGIRGAGMIPVSMQGGGQGYPPYATGDQTWICWQHFADDADPQDTIDTFFSTLGDTVTDVMVNYDVAETTPITCIGQSALCNESIVRINGAYLLDYIILKARQNGVRVHPWIIMNDWGTWGAAATSLLVTPIPDDAAHHLTDGGGSALNFNNAEVRVTLVAVITEILTNHPLVSGIALDYIRYDGLTSGALADVTQMIADVRAATSGKILSYCSKCTMAQEATFKQDMINWVDTQIIDTVFLMSYWLNWGMLEENYFRVADPTKARFLFGAGKDSTCPESTYEGHLSEMIRKGYNADTAHFQYSTMDDEAATFTALKAFVAGTLAITQPKVSKISVTPGTGFTIGLVGIDYDFTDLEVAGEVTNAALQAYVEAVTGAMPLVMVRRPTAATVCLNGRDWEPLP